MNFNRRDYYFKIAVIYFALLVVLVFIHNNYSIWDEDEGAYANFGKHMLDTGNWIMPVGMWSDVHRKPPLNFWNITLSFKFFGINEFSLRLATGIFTLLTYVLIFFAGKKLFDKKTALLAVFVLSTSMLVPAVGKIATVDSTLLFFTTLCAFAVLFILLHRSRKAVFIFWLSLMLGILTKGPPVVMFAVTFAGILFIFHPNRKNLWLLKPWFFLPLALLSVVYYCYLTTTYDGGAFINWFYHWYVLRRVNGSVFGQTAIPGAHLFVIVLLFFPYFMFAPSAMYNAVKNCLRDKEFSLLLVAWFFAGWFIYEISPSKLPTYVIASHVPFAFLLARTLVNQKRPAKISVIIHYFLQILLASAFIVFSIYFILSSPLILIGGIILLICSAVSIYFFTTKYFIKSVIGYGIAFQMVLWFILFPQIDTFKNGTKRIAAYVAETADKNSTVVIGNCHFHPPSLPFYLSLNFKNIIDEQRMAGLVQHYFSDTPTVLILNENQFQLLDSLVGNIPFKKFNNAEYLSEFRNPYFVIDNKSVQSKKNKLWVDTILAVAPLSTFQNQIEQSADYMKWIVDNSKKDKLSIEEEVLNNARWLMNNELAINKFDNSLRASQNWLAFLNKKSVETKIPLAELCRNYAVFIFNKGKIE